MTICEMTSDAGFFAGLVHGYVAVFSLIWDIFFEATVYDHCQTSWWYDLGFIIGLLVFFLTGMQLGFFFLLIMFIIWLILTILGILVYILPILVLATLLYVLYRRMSDTRM